MPKPRKRKSAARAAARSADPLPLSAKAPPLVDVHCHVFNGRDIPLKEFLHYGRSLPWGLSYLVETSRRRRTATSSSASSPTPT